MDKKLFADLKESFNQALEHAEGTRELRTTTLSRPKFLDKIKRSGWREINRRDRPAVTSKNERRKKKKT
jgi:hypothetical protein